MAIKPCSPRRILSTSCSSISSRKKSVIIRIESDSFAFVVFEEVTSNHTSGSNSVQDGKFFFSFLVRGPLHLYEMFLAPKYDNFRCSCKHRVRNVSGTLYIYVNVIKNAKYAPKFAVRKSQLWATSRDRYIRVFVYAFTCGKDIWCGTKQWCTGQTISVTGMDSSNHFKFL